MTAPLQALNFRVEILPGGATEPLCGAAFAECDGLELRLDVRTVREGGVNARQRLQSGPASYGEVTLRRGMTDSFDLWDWCSAVLRDPALRADARVIMLAPDGARERARFRLDRCLPVRLRAPRLDAREGIVAIEELTLACEALTLERPGGDAPAPRTVRAELRSGDRRVAVQLNPAALRVSRGAAGAALSFALPFEAPPDGDVRELTAAVAGLAAGDTPVTFAWGAYRFEGSIEALDEELDLFAADGRALRSTLAVTLRAPS
jgi:phage tail-like protein